VPSSVQNSFDRALYAACKFSSPRLRSSISTRVIRTSNAPQVVAVTIHQEFVCLVSQFLQRTIDGLVGNLESTEVVEATQNYDRCIEGRDMLLTMFPRSQS